MYGGGRRGEGGRTVKGDERASLQAEEPRGDWKERVNSIEW